MSDRTVTLNRHLSYSHEHALLAFELVHRCMKGNIYDNEVDNIILCIKTLRQEAGMSLVEAKCLIEFARDAVNHLKHTRLVGQINPLKYASY